MRLKRKLTPDYAGMTARRFLQEVLGFSSMQCKKIRLNGRLTVDGILQRMKDPLPPGGVLELLDPEALAGLSPVLRPEGKPYLVYADAWFVVAQKPAGVLSHPNFHDPKPALSELLAEPPLRPVQRLDRDTSGLMLLARHAHAHYRFSQTELRRRYRAFVHGIPTSGAGVIDRPIARNPGSSMERRIDPGGKRALSRWRCIRCWPAAGVSLLDLQLETGRTHQLRLHCLSAGWPLVGETLYTATRSDLGGFPAGQVLEPATEFGMERQALHCYQLGLTHPDPADPGPMLFTGSLPADMQALYERLESLRT